MENIYNEAKCNNNSIRIKMEGEQQSTIEYRTIVYQNPKHIRYVEDFISQNPNPPYKKLDLEGLDSKNVQTNLYDSIHERLYKKFARDGYWQKAQ